MLRHGFEPRPGLAIYFDTIAFASKFFVCFLVGTIAQILLIRRHSLNLDFIPSLLLHDGQAEEGRGAGAGIWRTWASRYLGGDRNRARAGRAGQGVRASWQEGKVEKAPTGKVKRDAAPGCELPDGAPQNKNLN